MKICVTASEKSLDAQLDPRFGRCRYFLIVDPETLEFEAVSNVAASAMHGAGIQAAQTVIEKGVEAIITGNVGPNAFQALSAVGIKIITGAVGTVKEVIEKYKRGELKTTLGSTVPSHFGVGTGRGMGLGRGLGMGFKRGMGRGLQQSPFQQPYSPQTTTIQKPEEEIAALEDYKKKLKDDLENLETRIRELKESIEKKSEKDR